MINKLLKVTYGKYTVYHVQCSSISEDGIRGPYKLFSSCGKRTKGMCAEKMDVGLFSFKGMTEIKVLKGKL